MLNLRVPFKILKRRSYNALNEENAVLSALFKAYTVNYESVSKYPAECIIFSMDRALQLHAFLGSYYDNVRPPVPLHIVYRTSTDDHYRAYQEVFSLYADRNLIAIHQESKGYFRTQLILILKSIMTENVIFFVDDIIVTEKIDIQDFAKFETRLSVPTLRMGENLKRSYTIQKDQKLPEFLNSSRLDSDKLCWIWQYGDHDWAYPLSVDGHLFSTREIIALAEHTDFASPNTFEANMQKHAKYFKHRLGICYKKSKIVNVPINKVQSDNDNLHGAIHQDYLLEQWNRGLQMDYRALYGIENESAHQEINIRLIERNTK